MSVIQAFSITYRAERDGECFAVYSQSNRMPVAVLDRIYRDWLRAGADTIIEDGADGTFILCERGDSITGLSATEPEDSPTTTPLPAIPFRAEATAALVASVLQDVEAKLDGILYGAEIVIALAAIRSSAEAKVREIVQPALLRYGAGELSIEELAMEVHGARNTPLSTEKD